MSTYLIGGGGYRPLGAMNWVLCHPAELSMGSCRAILCILAAIGISPEAVAQFVPGDLYVSAFDKIYHVDTNDWTFSTFADASEGITESGGVTFSPSGTLLCANFDTDELFEFDATAGVSTLYSGADGLNGPADVAYDVSGNLVIPNVSSVQILSFPVGGGAASLLADSGDGLFGPEGVAVDSAGRVLLLDFYLKSIWSIDTSGTVTAFDTLPYYPSSITCRSNGDIYVAAGNTGNGITIYRYPFGDTSQRYVFATFSNEFGWAAVQLSLNQKTIYFATVEALYTIDADSGSQTNVIDKTKGFFNSWSIAIFGKYLKAATLNYGTGIPGTLGVPGITSQADPVLGTSVAINLGNSAGQTTVGILFIGVQQADLPTGFGGHILLLPMITIPFTISTSGLTLSGALPDEARLAGTSIDFQAVEADAGASKGVSFSQGLELELGY